MTFWLPLNSRTFTDYTPQSETGRSIVSFSLWWMPTSFNSFVMVGEKNPCTNVKGLHWFREDLSQMHQEFVFIQRLSC